MHIPRKRFGQHFLEDQSIIQRIIAAIAPTSHDHLVEIGPGQGALTFPILRAAKELDVIELDRDLIPILEKEAQGIGRLHIYSGDVLEANFNELRKDERLLRVFGNLPYNISTPLVFHLLSFNSIISDMTFMLQKEVAYRLAAEPDSHDYGRLSIMAQYHCAASILFLVPKEAFNPPPQVESAIIKLTPHAKLPYVAKDYAHFATLVKLAFGQRRKTLRNSLRNVVPVAVWEALALNNNLRPENLSVRNFVEISNACQSMP